MENPPAASAPAEKASWGRRILFRALGWLGGLVAFAAFMLFVLRFEFIPALALLFGLEALIVGKVQVSSRRSVLGARARVLGAAWFLYGCFGAALSEVERKNNLAAFGEHGLAVIVAYWVAIPILFAAGVLLSKRIEEPPKSKAPPSLPSAPPTSLTLENPNRL